MGPAMKFAYLAIAVALIATAFLSPGTWLAAPIALGCAVLVWERWRAETILETALRQSRRDEEDIHALQAQLESQRERFRNLVDNSPASIFEYDRSLAIVYANRAFVEAMGTDLQTLLKFNLARSLDHSLEVCCREALGGKVTRYEGPYRSTIARLQLNIEAVCTPVFDQEGMVAGGIAILRDTTESNRLMRELQTMRDQYSDVVAKVPVGIYTFRFLRNGAMRFDFASPRFCQIFGIEREVVLADSNRVLSTAHPDERDSLLKANRESARTMMPFQWKGRFLVDGRIRWLQIESEGMALEDGSSVWNGVVADVTDRQKSEEALRESEANFRDLFQKMPLPSVLFDPESLKILMVNQAAIECYGYSAEEFLGKSLRDFRVDGNEQDDFVRPSVERNEIFHGVRRHRTKDGREFDAEFVIRELVLNGTPVDIGVARDVTADRRAQVELLEAKSQAEKASLAKSEFLATMSHEIRTPMNGVLGLLQIALSEEADPVQKSRLRKAHSAGRALLEILNDVLDYSRIEAGHLVLETVDFEPAKEIRGVADLFEAEILAKGVLFELEIGPEMPSVVAGDPHRLKQILSNLLGNAAKFTSVGKIRMEAFSKPLGADMVEMRFAVRDTGIGIPHDRIDQLFRPFEQVDSGITRRFGGTGLGLAICRDLVERMGGSIRVESEEGKGSVFEFHLPLRMAENSSPPDSQVPTEDVADEIVRERRRILLVEDNPLNQEVAKLLLEGAGYEVALAGNGQECLDVLAHERFDAILMDLHMPVMGGLEATRKLRYLRNGGDVPVIGLTADVRPSAVRECALAGMAAHVPKPFDPRRLLELLRKLTSPAETSAARSGAGGA